MSTPSIQTLITQAQQVLNLKSSNEIRATLAAILANANVGTPLNPNLTTQQLWDEFYEIVRQPSDDILSIITDQMMRMVFSPPAPGGAGADKQVIFNDGGVLAGDADLIFNKALNKLVANNIETAAGLLVGTSATITGDLTVDTSTLKVDSTNNRVGIGTASPTAGIKLDIVSTTSDNFVRFSDSVNATGYLGVQASNGTVYLHGNNNKVSLSCSTSNTTATEQLRITNPGVFEFLDGAGGTRMTLNSTGLGIGGSPAYKLDVVGPVMRLINSAATADIFITDSGTTNGNVRLRGESNALKFVTGGGVSATIDSSGNVGIGVTPIAWLSSLSALQVKGVSGLYGAGSSEFGSVQNCFYNASSQWIYGTTAAAGKYAISSGVHQWYNAPSGTAGNAITFTQAMTLDASGNLLVGKTVSSFSTVGVEASQAGFLSLTNSASTNAATNLSVYSTGAAAFRFYVGLAGTVFATNTTISAISDARLKENVQDLDVGLGAILALKPRKFDWKEGKGKNIKGDRGFIAQEFETVFPNLVDEWKDEAPEGEAPYKSVRQDLIPVLVKAIQELTARVQTLEAR